MRCDHSNEPKCDVLFVCGRDGMIDVQLLVNGFLDPLRWTIMACPFSPHSQGAWFNCSNQLSIRGGNSLYVRHLCPR
jgi:hypothetical protein